MKEHRKLNKLKVGISIFLIVLLLTLAVFGRFIYNSAREAYFTSKQFFFSSDILTVNGANYQYDNWGGVDIYEIEFDLYSYNNQFSRVDYDLEYTVTCESLSSKIACSINSVDGGTSTTGIIYAEMNGTPNNRSRVTILVTPLSQLNEDEEVKLRVTAKTEEPYEKEISCEYTLKIRRESEATYSIEDVANRDYALLKLVNGNDTSAQVTLTFDPTKVRLDLNDAIYQDYESIETDGNGYVKKIVFTMLEESSKNVKFYKVEKAQNYSYSGTSGTSVIQVTTM